MTYSELISKVRKDKQNVEDTKAFIRELGERKLEEKVALK